MQAKAKDIILKMVEDKATINTHLSKGGKLSDLKQFKFVSPIQYSSESTK